MFKKILVLSIVMFFAVVSLSFATGTNVDAGFDGKFKQSTSAYLDKTTVKKGIIKDGAVGLGVQSTTGKYSGPASGIGATGALGFTTVTVKNSPHKASASGIVGNIGATGFLGEPKLTWQRYYCWWYPVLIFPSGSLKGSGSLDTVAVKGGAVAQTSGKFKYHGAVVGTNGLIIGGGVTAGFSNASRTGNNVSSSAGGFTASGVVVITAGGYDRPQ
jgi:hypothetical protein